MQARWIRALLATDRLMADLHLAEAVLRDELLWSCIPREARASWTLEAYARGRGYKRGSSEFERGLMDWEELLLARPEIPKRGRVLVGGAGGGRELRCFAERGYGVTAFEPCEALAREAEVVAARFPGARVLRGEYADLAGVALRRGPLSSLAEDGPYALVVLGWRSLSHVLEERERLDLAAALRRVAPGAPVIASFLPRRLVRDAGRKRQLLRRALQAFGAPSRPPPGAAFILHAGFAVGLSPEDLHRMAAAGGYVAEVRETASEGIALFTPAS